MADYTDNALLASIKALEQTVLPAVNPADPLAGEQLRLVTGFLKFLRTRLPHWQARLVFELDHYLHLGRELKADAAVVCADASLRLETALEHAEAMQREGRTDAEHLREATRELSCAISGLARAAGTGDVDAALQRRIEHRILAGSKRWVDMQRSWFLPQGFELHPQDLPGLADILPATSVGRRTD